MQSKILFESPALSVLQYRCASGPSDPPYWESHTRFSLSYVQKGSFACESLGVQYQLVTGALLVGCSGEEYRCSHQHTHGGDECLSFQYSTELVDSLDSRQELWRRGYLPPTAETMVLSELAQATAEGKTDLGLDETALLLAERYLQVIAVERRTPRVPTAQERRRAIQAAEWLDAHSSFPIDLAAAAREVKISPFHFLRLFSKVLGVTPHQYLVRSRLRKAARGLADGSRSITEVALEVGFDDLSNFVRTFRRAAGVPPREFRRLARGKRKILQVG